MVTAGREPHGDLQTALQHASRLLQRNAALAAEQAQEILKVRPDADSARQILGAALRLQGEPLKALAVLEPLAERHVTPGFLHELGLCLAAAGRGDEAITVLRRAVQVEPKHADAWRSLGDQLSVAGDEQGSREAYERHLVVSTRHPELVDAAHALREARLPKAERLTREVLKRDPTDVIAIRMLAEIGLKLGRFKDASNLLKRCLELAPGFHLARYNYAIALFRRNKLEAALTEINHLLAIEPRNPSYLLLKGSVLVRKGDHPPALAIFEQVLRHYPRQANAHMNYGHTLKTVGRVDEAVAAYRRCIDLKPAQGEAWWSLANLKTFHFSDADVAAMRAGIVDEGGDPDDQAHLAFALGKALEDHGEYDQSFEYYRRGNAIRRKHHRYSAKKNIYDTARQIRALTAEFFAERRGWGCPGPDPVFIVGLPRAGSTLLEQILASHSSVDGTAELPDVIAISRRLGGRRRDNPAGRYPEILAELSADQCRELGEGYLQTTRVQRGDRPRFIDKMPNNFLHIGLIHLILPNARVIDARRHPMACSFSCYKQLFARGQTFTYDLTDMGLYYRDYVKLMDHWDAVLPGRVLRVQYEDMIADTEAQIGRLLDYCGLPFEEQCLRFYETERAVRTPSSEQVRRPIYTEGLEQWRRYDHHLGPLKEALGPVLQRYPI